MLRCGTSSCNIQHALDATLWHFFVQHLTCSWCYAVALLRATSNTLLMLRFVKSAYEPLAPQSLNLFLRADFFVFILWIVSTHDVDIRKIFHVERSLVSRAALNGARWFFNLLVSSDHALQMLFMRCWWMVLFLWSPEPWFGIYPCYCRNGKRKIWCGATMNLRHFWLCLSSNWLLDGFVSSKTSSRRMISSNLYVGKVLCQSWCRRSGPAKRFQRLHLSKWRTMRCSQARQIDAGLACPLRHVRGWQWQLRIRRRNLQVHQHNRFVSLSCIRRQYLSRTLHAKCLFSKSKLAVRSFLFSVSKMCLKVAVSKLTFKVQPFAVRGKDTIW